MENLKVAIIGAGSVGGAIAFGLLMRRCVKEILLVDMSQDILDGQVLDLTDASANTDIIVRAGTFLEASRCHVIVMAANLTRVADEKYSRWVARHEPMLRTMLNGMKPIQKKAFILVAVPPTEYMVHYLARHTGLDKNRIVGLGTTLASARFRAWLAMVTGSPLASIDACVIGTQQHPVPFWSTATLDGRPLDTSARFVEQKSAVEAIVSSDKDGSIAQLKGDAWFGRAAAAVQLLDKARNAPCLESLTVYSPDYDACVCRQVKVSLADGVCDILPLGLSSDETDAITLAVRTEQDAYQ